MAWLRVDVGNMVVGWIGRVNVRDMIIGWVIEVLVDGKGCTLQLMGVVIGLGGED